MELGSQDGIKFVSASRSRRLVDDGCCLLLDPTGGAL